MILSLLIVFTVQFFGVKGALEIIIEDIVYPVFNKEYLIEPDVYVNADNQVFINFTIVKSLPIETQSSFELLGASLGEYVIHTGIEQQMGLCEMIDEPVIVGPLLQMVGFRKFDCPPPPGIYKKENIEIPMELMPDEMTPNKYLISWELMYKEEKLLVVMIYINIH
ncbi:GSCOCG00006883001-RA-CDS [Cotesia congregata]|nr:GSCOCG00006883001-RA-CDS [Cotesia congregata]